MSNTVSRYGTFPIAFHWLTLLLLVAVYACIELREFFPKGSDHVMHSKAGILCWV